MYGLNYTYLYSMMRGKVVPESLPSVGPGADPGVQAADLLSHPGGRLPLLSASPGATFSAEERCRTSTSTKLYCLVTETHTRRCEQLVQGCYAALSR